MVVNDLEDIGYYFWNGPCKLHQIFEDLKKHLNAYLDVENRLNIFRKKFLASGLGE